MTAGTSWGRGGLHESETLLSRLEGPDHAASGPRPSGASTAGPELLDLSLSPRWLMEPPRSDLRPSFWLGTPSGMFWAPTATPNEVLPETKPRGRSPLLLVFTQFTRGLATDPSTPSFHCAHLTLASFSWGSTKDLLSPPPSESQGTAEGHRVLSGHRCSPFPGETA